MKVRNGVTSRVRAEQPEAGPVPRARVRPWDDPKPPLWLQYVLLSEQGDWVSCKRGKHWVNQWQSAIREFTASRAATGASTDLIAMWLLAFVNAFSTPSFTACGHARAAAAAIHLGQLVYCIALRPYRCLRDNAFRIVNLLCILAALVLVAVDMYKAAAGVSEPDVATGAVFLNVSLYVTLLQVVGRIIAEGAILVKGWRATSQMLEWEAGGGPGKWARKVQDQAPDESLSLDVSMLDLGASGAGRGLAAPLTPAGRGLVTQPVGRRHRYTRMMRGASSGSRAEISGTLSSTILLPAAGSSPAARRRRGTGSEAARDVTDLSAEEVSLSATFHKAADLLSAAPHKADDPAAARAVVTPLLAAGSPRRRGGRRARGLTSPLSPAEPSPAQAPSRGARRGQRESFEDPPSPEGPPEVATPLMKKSVSVHGRRRLHGAARSGQGALRRGELVAAAPAGRGRPRGLTAAAEAGPASASAAGPAAAGASDV
eukprot:TRINITY_DN18732_c0_g1_i2.p1 TRINITY_DN18732_c0_g1~~TRINITY_DN18732_c0_g1_i2.p1  ORF type:complete len:486 (+),score=73.95 TRINITY_DN18732_c0_g1_i2:1643-3100(+)